MRAVLFDLGGTLIKTAPIPEIIKRILAAYGIQRPQAEIALAQKTVDEQMPLEDYTLAGHDFWVLWNTKILEHLGIQADVKKELAEALFQKWWENADVALYPDVKPTLETLRQMNLKIGIVTNGFQSDIDEIMVRTSLGRFFDVTVGVDAVKKPKPHPEIFLYAVEHIGVSPEEILFVGDDPTNDYAGAKKAGLKALLIDRESAIRGKMRKIRNLREVSKYL